MMYSPPKKPPGALRKRYLVVTRIYEHGSHILGCTISEKRMNKVSRSLKAWRLRPKECAEALADSQRLIIEFFDRASMI